MKKELWLVFYLFEWEELAAYTLRGTFLGECEATKKMLAAEYGVSEKHISAVIEERYSGKRRTSA